MTYDAGSQTPHSNAQTLGTLVRVALTDSAHAYVTLKQVAEALTADDIDQAKLLVGNYFAPGSSPFAALTNLQQALYDSVTRAVSDTSYG